MVSGMGLEEWLNEIRLQEWLLSSLKVDAVWFPNVTVLL